jgi:hypothetical protein
LVKNSYYNAFYLNMLSSEMFLDSCQKFDSGSSHAKELNYLPRSAKSAVIDLDIIVNTGNTSQTSFFCPKFTTFYGRVGSNVYFFSTNSNITATSTNSTDIAANVQIYEGDIVSEAFAMDYANTFQRFILSNPSIDTTSISLNVVENNGANTYSYLQVSDLFNLNANSLIYFLECTTGGLYEVIFGDGTIGRIPLDGAIISATYRSTNADIPNGVANVSPNGLIGGFSNVSVNVLNAAHDGFPRETLDSIKFNGPRAFEAQDRAVIPLDFATLLQINFPEISAIHAYGGDTLVRPQYGKVFIAIALSGISSLPISKINQYKNFLEDKAVATLTPVFINPSYVFLFVQSIVNYNINVTKTDPAGIRSEVINAITTFSNTNLSNFNTNFYYSQFVSAISNSDLSIISNETTVRMISYISYTANTKPQTFTANFGQPVISPYSSSFYSNGHLVSLSTVAATGVTTVGGTPPSANMGILKMTDSFTRVITNVGNVNFTTGLCTFTVKADINPATNNTIKLYAGSPTLDIIAGQNIILKIAPADLSITVNEVSI